MDEQTSAKEPSRGTRLYELFFHDPPGAWRPGDPVQDVDSWPFRRGERIEAPAGLHVPVENPGDELAMTMKPGLIVVGGSVAGGHREDQARWSSTR